MFQDSNVLLLQDNSLTQLANKYQGRNTLVTHSKPAQEFLNQSVTVFLDKNVEMLRNRNVTVPPIQKGRSVPKQKCSDVPKQSYQNVPSKV